MFELPHDLHAKIESFWLNRPFTRERPSHQIDNTYINAQGYSYHSDEYCVEELAAFTYVQVCAR